MSKYFIIQSTCTASVVKDVRAVIQCTGNELAIGVFVDKMLSRTCTAVENFHNLCHVHCFHIQKDVKVVVVFFV